MQHPKCCLKPIDKKHNKSSNDEWDDWFVNQKTGEVIHNPNEGKGWEKTLGKDWAYLAKEDEIIDINERNIGEPIDIWYTYYVPAHAQNLMEQNNSVLAP